MASGENITKEDLKENLEAMEKLLKVIDGQPPRSNSIGNSKVYINAGGIGVLIVTGFASFMCGVCIFLAFMLFSQQKKIDDLHDYLNVIYQYAPQLKPKDFK